MYAVFQPTKKRARHAFLFARSARLCLAMVVAASITPCEAQICDPAKIDSDRLWEIERLVVKLPNDSFGGLEGLTQQELDAWRAKSEASEQERISRIKSEPGLAPYLIALLDHYLANPGRDGLPMILEAIAKRGDMPNQELRRLFGQARVMLAGSKSVPQPDCDDFLIGMASVMAAHPSPDNEAMLVKMLQMRNEYAGVLVALAAGKALAATGSPNARSEIEAAAKWFRNYDEKRNRKSDFARLFYGYAAQFEERLSLPQTSPSTANPSAPQEAKAKQPESNMAQPESSTLFRWAVIITAATGLLSLILERRGKC